MASTHPTTPSRSPSNPYAPVFLTPLHDTARRDANDYYLSGREGLNSVADFHYSYYSNLGLPGDTFSEVQYMFSDLIGFWSTPNVRRDKLSKSFNRLTSLEPAEFLDFYAYLSNELIHYNIALMPFDAIDINYGYVGLCFPGVGERRYLQMTSEAFRVFDYALPHEESSVQVASRKHGGHKPDGYRFLWDVMTHSQPVFATFVPNRQPQWQNANGDLLLHAKRWIAYFRFEAKKYSYATDVQKSLLYLRSIHDQTLLGTIKSLEMAIMTHEAQTENQFLPIHLQIQQLADSLTLTLHPLDSELHFAPSGNHYHSRNPLTTGHSSPSIPLINQPVHIMQSTFPSINLTDSRHRSDRTSPSDASREGSRRSAHSRDGSVAHTAPAGAVTTTVHRHNNPTVTGMLLLFVRLA
jgi:hypothetical protein